MQIELNDTLKVLELRKEAPSQYFDYIGMVGTVTAIETIAEETMYTLDFSGGSAYNPMSFFEDEVEQVL